MPAIDLSAALAVLVTAALVAVVVVAAVASRRQARFRGAVPQPVTTIGSDDRRLALVPRSIRRGFSVPVSADVDPLGRKLDKLTGLLGTTDWNRLMSEEDVRHARYRRPATVVVIELDGLERLVPAIGSLAADRVIRSVADIIHRQARKADHVARLGASRFGVLLPETDEVAAINYVERAREAADRWLESGAISLRLAIGWASPSADSSVEAAQAQAIERMLAEIRQRGPRTRVVQAGPADIAPGPKRAPSTI